MAEIKRRHFVLYALYLILNTIPSNVNDLDNRSWGKRSSRGNISAIMSGCMLIDNVQDTKGLRAKTAAQSGEGLKFAKEIN